MSSSNHRILLDILMPSSSNPQAAIKITSLYLRFNNALTGSEQFPNISKICNYCDGVNKKLGAYIRNSCLDIRSENTIFEPSINKTNSIRSIVEDSERKKIRIILYPGNRNDITDLKMDDTTHTMIVQFEDGQCGFKSTDPHENFPSFYQICNSEETALLYLEALIVDACICHYLSVSDVAYHHDNKQKISLEKVTFLKELVEKENIGFLSQGAQNLVKYVVGKLNENTPYISFFSIFTVASIDIFNNTGHISDGFFEDFCMLWHEFQKWYFERHGRSFSITQVVDNPQDTLLDRNKYQGQISPSRLASEINQYLTNPICNIYNKPFGLELRYAAIIIKHTPTDPSEQKQIEALFRGDPSPVDFKVVHWGDIERYDTFSSYLEIVPFIINNN